MTRGSGIRFWEILNDKALYSRLDSSCLPGCLGFSGVGFKVTTAILSCCLVLVFVPIYFSAFLRSREEDHVQTRAVLRALLTVLVPTCSLWPSRYIELASAPRSRVDIPLDVVIEDTIDGVIEFCNPINDLADLMGGGVAVNEYAVCIKIGWKWWISCFHWWMLAKSKSEYVPGPSYRLHCNMSATNSSPMRFSLNPFPLTSSTSNHLLCLDSLPHDTIPSLNAGCKTTLEFTAFSPSLRMLSTAQIISAIPFIISKHSRRHPRPLASVLKQLSASYGPRLVVHSFSNISVDYEHALRHMYKSFSEELKIREMRVKNLGIKTWRQDMFLVALEAALVHQGWIERWAVQVTVK